jgi:hypothetical protein
MQQDADDPLRHPAAPQCGDAPLGRAAGLEAAVGGEDLLLGGPDQDVCPLLDRDWPFVVLAQREARDAERCRLLQCWLVWTSFLVTDETSLPPHPKSLLPHGETLAVETWQPLETTGIDEVLWTAGAQFHRGQCFDPHAWNNNPLPGYDRGFLEHC